MRLKRPEGLNIIPFIDIMLVLLAIVLSVSTFIAHRHLVLELPKAHASEAPSKKLSHEIVIDAQGVLYWEEKAVSLEDLKTTLHDTAKEDELVLKADTKSAFGTFIEVIDCLKSLNHPHITILVRKD